MDTKTTSWVAYLTWIGFIVAMCTGDKEGAKFHLNQALVIHIFISGIALVFNMALGFVLPFMGIIGCLANLFILVCWILGLVAAINQEEKEVPLIGEIKILK